MTAIPSGADVLANNLLQSLIAGKSFAIPTVNLSDDIFTQPIDDELALAVTPLTTEDLTTGVVGGTGVFDKLMSSLVTHLKVEYTANRISGAQYSEAYVGIIQAALATSAQYLLGKDQAYWQALLVREQARAARIQVIKARVELEIARVSLIRTQYEAATTEVNYALIKLKLATEDVNYNNATLQGNILVAQKTGVDRDNDTKSFTYTQILPIQRDLLQEQYNVQRAQTSNSRHDGALVVGVLGKQKDLYSQQIISYQRDAETKVVKIWTDAWITMKTIDEGLKPPTLFVNKNVNVMLNRLKQKVGF